MIAGFATAEGTQRLASRFEGKTAAGHYKTKHGLSLSSVGLGTYLGEPDDATDSAYCESVLKAAEFGLNVLDTAVNYRCQRSERAIGRALEILIKQKGFSRDEIVVATKGGFIPFDGDFPADENRYVNGEYMARGILEAGDVVAGCHAMTPRYLADQLERSRKNLGLDTIDIYYLHNPETQLEEVPKNEFLGRVKKAFEFFEKAVAEGKIRMYGTATWNGYRSAPQSKGYLSLEELVLAAREVAGAGHHFKAVQLPYSLAMPEAFLAATQQVGAGWISTVEACERYDMIVMSSASLMQGRLAKNLPGSLKQVLKGFKTDAQCALQFIRSTPGISSALVGMKSAAHVEENLQVAKVPPLSRELFAKLFSSAS